MKAYIGIILGGVLLGELLNRYIDQTILKNEMTWCTQNRFLKNPLSPNQAKNLGYDILLKCVISTGFVMVYFYNGCSMKTLIGWTFVSFAILLSIIDYREMILPTFVIKWGSIVGLIEWIIQAMIEEKWEIVMNAVMGAAVGYLLFMSVFYISHWILNKEGIGYGDVRLMGFIGLYIGLNTLFLTLLIASLLASVYGMILLYLHKKSEAYPLGPFLNIGGIIIFLWGHEMTIYSVEFFESLIGG